MQTLIFKVIQQQPVDIDFNIDTIRKFPIHSHFMVEVQEKIIIYKFDPTKTCDLEQYKTFLCNYLKEKYKAYSVTVGELEKQLN